MSECALSECGATCALPAGVSGLHKAGGQAGRPDPAASRRSVPTARPGSWAGSTPASRQLSCCAPASGTYPERGLQIYKPIVLRG